MGNIASVAVIGAGIAGLSCAGSLQSAGWKVTVFEKSRGIGGRMSTRRGEDWQCDHGAQYFTARDPAFVAEIDRWQAAGVAAPWAPRLSAILEQDVRRVERSLLRYVGVPRMSAPTRLMAQGLEVLQHQTVSALVPVKRGWSLHSKEAGELEAIFDAVVLALPAPQAVPLLAPVAPKLLEQAQVARMYPSWAMALQFDAPLSLDFDAAFVNAGPLRWVARDTSKPGRTGRECWLLHATSEWSELHLEEPAETVAAALLKVFADLCGAVPVTWSIHRWRYADCAPEPASGSLWDDSLRIGMCGDWLNGGKVEGAWLSGQHLAAQML